MKFSNLRKGVLISALAITFSLSFSSVALAQINEDEYEAFTEVIEDSELDELFTETEETEEEEDHTGILTPSGNLSLVDDVTKEDEKEVQYMTVQTRNGEYFYLIIDKTGNGQNVYFLNMVDEKDLTAILSEEEQKEINEPEKPPVEIDLDDEKEEIIEKEPEKKTGSFLSLFLFVAIVVGILTGYYFLKIKPGKTKKEYPDEFSFEDDEDIGEEGPEELTEDLPWEDDEDN